MCGSRMQRGPKLGRLRYLGRQQKQDFLIPMQDQRLPHAILSASCYYEYHACYVPYIWAHAYVYASTDGEAGQPFATHQGSSETRHALAILQSKPTSHQHRSLRSLPFSETPDLVATWDRQDGVNRSIIYLGRIYLLVPSNH